jgi:hypothetical protein
LSALEGNKPVQGICMVGKIILHYRIIEKLLLLTEVKRDVWSINLERQLIDILNPGNLIPGWFVLNLP